MKFKLLLLIAPVLVLSSFFINEVWTKEQLMDPRDLANEINSKSTDKSIIYNIGPAGSIQGAIHIGGMDEKENVTAFEKHIESVAHDKSIVIYCGCCPFQNCPNIRPAFSLLTKKGFTNHKLLNLPHNLKVDWIDKGYPMN